MVQLTQSHEYTISRYPLVVRLSLVRIRRLPENTVLFNTNTEELKQVPIISLSKPETPAQKEERKRLETVKDMFSYWSEDEGDFVAGDADDRKVVSLLFALYDAGYERV